MKFRIIISILFLSTTLAQAQSDETIMVKPSQGVHLFPDSIRLEFQDQSTIVIIQSKSLAQGLERVNSFFKSFNQLLETVEKSTSDLTSPRKVDYWETSANEKRMVISETPVKSTKVHINEKGIAQLLPPGWEFNIHSKNSEIYVYSQTFEQLRAVAVYQTEPLEQLLKSRSEKVFIGRKRMIAHVIVQKGAILYEKVRFQMPEDFVIGTGGAGIGFLGDRFYPTLNVMFSFRFGNHFNRPNHKISILYDNLFFMERKLDGGFSAKTNSFLSLAWGKNMYGTGRFFGMGAGYLIHQKGDYFKGRTMKFFITNEIGRFTVGPEFYLTEDLKNFQMGIKLNYTF